MLNAFVVRTLLDGTTEVVKSGDDSLPGQDFLRVETHNCLNHCYMGCLRNEKKEESTGSKTVTCTLMKLFAHESHYINTWSIMLIIHENVTFKFG